MINLTRQFWDKQDQLCLECSASRTLKNLDNGELKIIVAVLNDA
ncbi:MAG: hypothetical protein ACI808_000287 [Paraglaciecola sp.]|jgi:hypothetical protein